MAWILIKFFYHVEIRGRENFKNLSGPLIIVSNHVKWFDPFLVAMSTPLLSGLFPLRYMTEDKKYEELVLELLRKFGFNYVIYLIGGFPSRRGEGVEMALHIPSQILSRKGSVVIFPEGEIIRGTLGEFRQGAAALAVKSNAPILPFFIKIEDRKIIITIGEVFELKNFNFNEGTSVLKAKIENLQTL